MVTETSVVCPHCKNAFDRLTGIGREDPDPGDFNMCIRCGEISVFNEHLVLRVPSVDEYMDAGRNEDISRVRSAWLAVQAMKQDEEISKLNMLDASFAEIEKGLVEMTGTPPQAIAIMKTVFVLGAKSVFALMDKDKYEASIAAAMLGKYRHDIDRHIHERAKSMINKVLKK